MNPRLQMSSLAEQSAEIPLNPSLQQLEREKALDLARIRVQLDAVSVRDLLPTLVARQVLRTYEMGAVYAKVGWVSHCSGVA